MKHLKITAAAAAILLIILIFLPVPLRVDRKLAERRIAADKKEEAPEISVHGRRFHYLVRKEALDILRAHLTISPSLQENARDFFSVPVISHDVVCRTNPARYSTLRNEYIAAQIRFTDGFDKSCIRMRLRGIAYMLRMEVRTRI